MGKLKVLFACVENSFRSQISEGIAGKYFSDRIDAYSAGSKPSGTVHPNAVKVLKEIGIDASKQYSKGFSDLEETEFDYLVTMGCGEVCPFVPSRKQLNWELPDIKDNPLEDIRELRDHIKNKIEKEILEDTYEK
ncbi:MAG: arsenate reductase ArsC [candidate division WOR-3 bacterium]|nr:arsenate reductase ArsC [candidate division WOR-3 bacterium]